VRDAVREAIVAELRHSVSPGERWVEIGCANSNLLYDFPHRLQARLDGVDSASDALAATGAALARTSIDATLRLHDFRELADGEEGSYDGVVSCGFAEHFTDCTDVHRHLARYVRPGGRVVTFVPNMSGLVGLLQVVVDEEVFLTHHVLTPPVLADSMREAGLSVDRCEPFIGVNLGVVNAGGLSRSGRRAAEAVLVGTSRALALAERTRGRPFAPRMWRSPYLVAVATV
jgi:cyclopropane fatty-acyl-phospholipid synthase-like methyltransferase